MEVFKNVYHKVEKSKKKFLKKSCYNNNVKIFFLKKCDDKIDTFL